MKKIVNSAVTRRTFLGGSAAAAMLGLAACGGSGSSSSSSSSSTGTEGGGALTVGSAYSPSSYDPANCSSAFCLSANSNVMEGLYNIDFTNYSVISGLAAGEPTEVDANTYEVTLRDGAKFSDGTDVTADDVVFSFGRATADGGMYVSFLTMFDSIEKKDDKTVTVKVNIPNFSLLKERLAIIKVMPASLSTDDAASKPVGSGPWMYNEMSDTYVVLKPNPNYNGEFPAKDNELRIESLSDTTARTTAQSEGTTLISESIPPESIDQLEAAGVDVDQVEGFGTRFIMFNVKKAPWNDVKVRQAIMYALNTDQMITNAFSGLASVATSYLPSTFTNYHKASVVYEYDADKAKSLLSEAGVTPGSIVLRTTDNAQVVAMGTQAQQDLQALGFTVELTSDKSAATYAAIDQADESWDILIAPGDPSCFGGDTDLLLNWWFGDNVWMKTRCAWNTSEEWKTLNQKMSDALAASAADQQNLWNECFDILAENVTLYPVLQVITPTGSWRSNASPKGEKVSSNFKGIGTTGVQLAGVNTITA
ncbi:ABC transporter substrate-binding protein [Paratractidigestivibacter sp.]|uniref:ABC transporter substrate-binding protein n=1 Tax=Paratractidigestivibacter sp. TaxID=2847316 RepID=UPI002ABE6A8E|nr:ABC transporter substrate-binding protein [Paratractidigestivibacter sp.]